MTKQETLNGSTKRWEKVVKSFNFHWKDCPTRILTFYPKTRSKRHVLLWRDPAWLRSVFSAGSSRFFSFPNFLRLCLKLWQLRVVFRTRFSEGNSPCWLLSIFWGGFQSTWPEKCFWFFVSETPARDFRVVNHAIYQSTCAVKRDGLGFSDCKGKSKVGPIWNCVFRQLSTRTVKNWQMGANQLESVPNAPISHILNRLSPAFEPRCAKKWLIRRRVCCQIPGIKKCAKWAELIHRRRNWPDSWQEWRQLCPSGRWSWRARRLSPGKDSTPCVWGRPWRRGCWDWWCWRRSHWCQFGLAPSQMLAENGSWPPGAIFAATGNLTGSHCPLHYPPISNPRPLRFSGEKLLQKMLFDIFVWTIFPRFFPTKNAFAFWILMNVAATTKLLIPWRPKGHFNSNPGNFPGFCFEATHLAHVHRRFEPCATVGGGHPTVLQELVLEGKLVFGPNLFDVLLDFAEQACPLFFVWRHQMCR